MSTSLGNAISVAARAAAIVAPFGITAPTHAQSIALECEIENVVTTSMFGYEPLRQFYFGMVQLTLDLSARKAMLKSTADDGTPQTTIRDLLSASQDEVVLCQADVCQREVANGSWMEKTSLTTIDLRTGRLTRRVEAELPSSYGLSTRTIVRDGSCRRI